MREKLISYVNLLFAGTEGVEDIQQEILQNTLDRFDDLVSRGSTPENAYRQAIAGIGMSMPSSAESSPRRQSRITTLCRNLRAQPLLLPG